MEELELVQTTLNVMSAPFGFTAMYYGYKGYRATRGGLKAYKYFFFAMFGLGAAMLFDLIFLLTKVLSYPFLIPYLPYFDYAMGGALIFVALFMALSFRDIYNFVSKTFKV